MCAANHANITICMACYDWLHVLWIHFASVAHSSSLPANTVGTYCFHRSINSILLCNYISRRLLPHNAFALRRITRCAGILTSVDATVHRTHTTHLWAHMNGTYALHFPIYAINRLLAQQTVLHGKKGFFVQHSTSGTQSAISRTNITMEIISLKNTIHASTTLFCGGSGQ